MTIYRGFKIEPVSGGFNAVGSDASNTPVTLGGTRGELLTEEHAMIAVDNFKRYEAQLREARSEGRN